MINMMNIISIVFDFIICYGYNVIRNTNTEQLFFLIVWKVVIYYKQ